MDEDRRAEGGHDAKGAAPEQKSAAGKAVGYSDADPADLATGRDGLRPTDTSGDRKR